MAYCGNCGNSFEPGALIDGRCPACGARISSTGNVVALDQINTVPMRGPFPPPLPRAEDDPMALPAAAAAERVMVRVDPHNVVVLDQRTSRGPNLILTLLVLAALLLLIGIAALASVQWNPLQLVIPASTATTNATLVSTSVSTVPATAAPAGSSTASTGTPVVATPTSLTSVTATPGGPPTLSVDQTQFTQLLCLGPLGASIHFQVLNSGGGSLAWTANPSDNVSPASGSLAHNEPQTVTVSMILLSRSITISAIGAQDSPQTVTITCRA